MILLKSPVFKGVLIVISIVMLIIAYQNRLATTDNDFLEENKHKVILINSDVKNQGCIEVSKKGSDIWEHTYLNDKTNKHFEGKCGEDTH